MERTIKLPDNIDFTGKKIPKDFRNLSNTLAFLSEHPFLLNIPIKYSAEKLMML